MAIGERITPADPEPGFKMEINPSLASLRPEQRLGSHCPKSHIPSLMLFEGDDILNDTGEGSNIGCVSSLLDSEVAKVSVSPPSEGMFMDRGVEKKV